MTSDKFSLVYSTFPTLQDAERIGKHLVAAKLAACVNIIPTIVSIYVWEGQCQRDQEVAMLIKTRTDYRTDVVKEITRLHPYDTPAVLVLPVTAGSSKFLDWIETQTNRRNSAGKHED